MEYAVLRNLACAALDSWYCPRKDLELLARDCSTVQVVLGETTMSAPATARQFNVSIRAGIGQTTTAIKHLELSVQCPCVDERGGFRQVEARKLGAVEGGWSDLCELGGDNERAFKASGNESPRPDLHERGRLRHVKAGELGAEKGPSTDGLHGRANFKRAREACVVLQESIRDGHHGRVRQLPARLRAARSDGAPLQPGHRDKSVNPSPKAEPEPEP